MPPCQSTARARCRIDPLQSFRAASNTHYGLLVVIATLPVLTVGAAEAQSLHEAMITAYRSNPGLQSQRFQARATAEAVPRALSGYRPRVVADAFYGANAERGANSERGDGRFGRNAASPTYGYGLKIEQPLFDGFRTRNGVLEAESGVRASRYELEARENEVLLQVARTYLDVLRDEGVVLYRRKTLSALKRELVGARERLSRGRITVTDIEQAKQRLAIAQSDLAKATGALEVSGYRYARVTGVSPNTLRMPRLPNRLLPKTLRSATTAALRTSPIIRAARHSQKAATHAVSRVRGELLPTANLVAGYDRSFNEATRSSNQDSLSIVGRLRVPLYQGGGVSARVRAARNTAASRDRETADARLQVGEAVGAAWSEMATARRREQIEKRAIAAAARALAGVREEQRLGRRTVLDVLDAERELVEARIRILNTKRDLHVSAYALLRAIGSLTVVGIAPGAERYDPNQYARQVRGKWWGTAPPTAGSTGFMGAGAVASWTATVTGKRASSIGSKSSRTELR